MTEIQNVQSGGYPKPKLRTTALKDVGCPGAVLNTLALSKHIHKHKWNIAMVEEQNSNTWDRRGFGKPKMDE